jgi:formylglycine-generating enzyme required for sulfatase activity
MRALALALVVVVAGAAVLGLAGVAAPRGDRAAARDIAVVALPAGAFDYRLAGDFTRDGLPTNGPLVRVAIDAPFDIMAHQVSQRDYARCVAEAACPKLSGPARTAANLPVVGVSWRDATAYAAWLSRRAGEDWRLPTDVEWAYAAGERFRDDPIVESASDDYAQRWLERFDQDSARADLPKAPQPFGRFGANAKGVVDLAGNVWEWTDACYERRSLDAAGAPTGPVTRNCGVRVIEGGHRMAMSDFIRDGLTGGCSVGQPPTNLGIRLVRHRPSAWRRALGVVGDRLALL